jgi:PAS domain S-box-containing protein
MGDDLARVLLVDDDEDDYIITADLLSEIPGASFDLEWVATYEAGLEAIGRGEHDVYLVDYRLGERDGLGLLQEAIKNGRKAPLILLTGQGDHEVDVQAMKAGAADFLVKGQINASLLERSIRYAIERARTLETLRQSEERYRRRNRELALLNRLIAALTDELELNSILETACRELAVSLGLSRVDIALLNDEKTKATVAAECVDEDRSAILGQTIPVVDNPWFQHLLIHRTPLVANEVQADPRLGAILNFFHQQGTASLVVLPLVIKGDVVGSLALEAARPHHFSTDDVNLAWSVADQVAGAVARSELAQTRQRLITAIEQTADGVVITNAEGAILYVNPAFERTTGFTRADVVGQNLCILNSGEQGAALYRDLWATIKAGDVWHGRLVNKRKDGSLYTIDSTITPIRNSNDSIVSFVGVNRDVTRELQLEEQYRQAQKMEAIGRLTGGIAHDFNNLLTAIDGFAELAQFQLSPDDPVQELIDKTRQSSRRAAALVSQLLAFSRRQIIKPQVLVLNEVVAELDKMLQRIIGEDIDLEIKLAPGLWPVKIDPTQIEQVIVNLGVNARDAMPTGGKLTIETANVVLDENSTACHVEVQPGEYVLLAVGDTGIGMSQEVRTHIFEPFFTTKENGQGTGLGLATVYGIVKQSRGDIQCHSEEGVGTTFSIYLPRSDEAAQPVARREPGQRIPSGGETILLVEDNDEVRELAQRILQRQGYTLLQARDGQEALQLATSYSGPIHLLLTDVIMPGINGVTLAEQLAHIRSDSKVLFMSGYTDDKIEHHGVLEAGVAFLQKPFSPMDLARRVRAVLDS